ncbi:hypothetical protein ADO06_01906 [Streptococcus parauberis]|nr:hypothetical protein ADO06_01906 [Streptococcus parauberis]
MLNVNDSPLLSIPTIPLIFAFILIIFISYLIAYHNRNNFDFKKSAKEYAICTVIYFFVLLWLRIKLILIFGLIIMGFIILLFRSDHYFNK